MFTSCCRRAMSAVIAGVLVLSAVGCGGDDSGGSDQAAAAPDEPSLEGQTIHVQYWPTEREWIEKLVIKPFEDETGAKVVTSLGATGDTVAKVAAQKFLDRDHAYYPYEPAKKVTTCQRKSARTVDCAYKAVGSNGTADCGTVRVRLKNARAKRPTVAFHGSPAMCAA